MTNTQAPAKPWLSTSTAELMAAYYEVQAKGLASFMPEFMDEAHAEITRRLSEAEGLHLVGMEPGSGGILAHCQFFGCDHPTEVDLEWSDGAHKSACWAHAKHVGNSRNGAAR